MDSTDFLHNDALLVQHEIFRWAALHGSQPRTGVASTTVTNCHYDGGYTSAGIFPFGAASAFRVDGEGPDEPDATWSVTYQGCDWVDVK